jgi:predicted nucleic acid-binding protein
VSAYLLDTNVLSELRKGVRANAAVVGWAKSVINEEHFVSVLALGEIRKGIESIRGRDPVQASALEQWLRETEADFGDRVLPVTKAISDKWGRLMAVRALPVSDALMAATALTHSLTFVTRNGADVQHTGVNVFNPF